MRCALSVLLVAFASVSNGQTLPGGPGGGSGGPPVTTTVILNNDQGTCMLAPDGDRRCPGNLGDLIDELNNWSGSACGFGSICEVRNPAVPGLGTKVCPGADAGGAPAQVDNEVAILNAGAATTVPTFKPAVQNENGNGLRLIDLISCYSITECKCKVDPQGISKCEKGNTSVYQLARYEIDSRLVCVGTAE